MRTIPATPALVPRLLDAMGPERAAVVTAGMDDVQAAFADAIARSPVTWCGLDEHGVVNMGGFLPTSTPGLGYLWHYLGRGIERHKRAYILQGRAMMQEARRHFARLLGIVEAEYRAALRHMARLGWTVAPPELINGRPACRCTVELAA